MNVIKNTPIAISGLLLATLSMGNLYNNSVVKAVTFTIGFTIILVLLLKVLLYESMVREELSQLIVLSTSGTFSMALMLISTYLITINYYLALFLWISGIILHILLIITFTYRHVLNDFDIRNVYGSYWVVFVGITMAAITGPILDLQGFSWIFFVFGFCMMLITFPLVTYRYVKYPQVQEIAKPLICIYTALFSILIVGYTSSFTVVNITFLLTLYAMACICYIFSFYKLLTYLKMPFYPSYSAFTFPFVISAIASTKVMALFNGNVIMQLIIVFEMITATLMVCYVLIEYIMNIFNLS